MSGADVTTLHIISDADQFGSSGLTCTWQTGPPGLLGMAWDEGLNWKGLGRLGRRRRGLLRGAVSSCTRRIICLSVYSQIHLQISLTMRTRCWIFV
jgi:hypothetical protein